MSWSTCQQALNLHLMALADLNPQMVALPNVVFPGPGVTLDDKIHYRVDLLPSDSWAPYGTGTLRRFKGIYQVSVYAPAGKGDGAFLAAVDALCAHFDRLNLSRNAITLSTETPIPGPALIDGQWIYTPVSVHFYTR